MIPNKIFQDRLERPTKQLLKAFDCITEVIRYFVLEWHRRAHKTTDAINLIIREACKYPRSKYVYIAPTQVMAREIVWDDPNMLPDALPDKDEMSWKRNEQKMTITFGNGSIIKLWGADNPDASRGIDADGVVFDEYALIKPSTWTESYRSIIAGPKKPGHRERWAMFLYTPKGQNHASKMFNIASCVENEFELPEEGKSEEHKPGWFASRLIADKSGIIERKELDAMLQEIEDGLLTQVEYDQEQQCRRVTDEERTLITSAMLARLDQIQWENYRDTKEEIRRIVSIDPAFGGDICSLKGFENSRELCQDNVKNPNMRTNDIVVRAKQMAEEVRRISRASYGLSTSGVAGPDGGTPDKPVGTICIGLATPGGSFGKQYQFHYPERIRNKKIFAMTALNLLRRELLK